MKNLNTKEVLNKVASEMSEETGAMLVIAADDGHHVRTFMFGCDPMGMSPNAVALAAALHDLLDGHLGIADSIYRRFVKEGNVNVQSQTVSHKYEKPKCDCAAQSSEEENHGEQPNPADLRHKMIDAIFCGSDGGDSDEDDD